MEVEAERWEIQDYSWLHKSQRAVWGIRDPVTKRKTTWTTWCRSTTKKAVALLGHHSMVLSPDFHEIHLLLILTQYTLYLLTMLMARLLMATRKKHVQIKNGSQLWHFCSYWLLRQAVISASAGPACFLRSQAYYCGLLLTDLPNLSLTSVTFWEFCLHEISTLDLWNTTPTPSCLLCSSRISSQEKGACTPGHLSLNMNIHTNY